MSETRTRSRPFLSILLPLALLASGYFLDDANHLIARTGEGAFDRVGTFWSLHVLLDLLFVAGVFFYARVVVNAVRHQPAASIASLMLCGIVFVYASHFFGFLPQVVAVEMPTSLARQLGNLTNLHPRSFFMLSTSTLAVGGIIGLWRYARRRSTA